MKNTITYDYNLKMESVNLKLGDVFNFEGNYIDTSIIYNKNFECDSEGYLYFFDSDIGELLWIKFLNVNICNRALSELDKLPEDNIRSAFYVMLLNRLKEDKGVPEGYL